MSHDPILQRKLLKAGLKTSVEELEGALTIECVDYIIVEFPTKIAEAVEHIFKTVVKSHHYYIADRDQDITSINLEECAEYLELLKQLFAAQIPIHIKIFDRHDSPYHVIEMRHVDGVFGFWSKGMLPAYVNTQQAYTWVKQGQVEQLEAEIHRVLALNADLPFEQEDLIFCNKICLNAVT